MRTATRRERDAGPKAATRAWLRQETQRGSRAARPVVALGLAGTLVAVGQTYCIARALAAALTGHSLPILALTAFALLALARAALAWAAELLAARAGAVSRRRLRSDVLTRLLHAGPALLRSGTLAIWPPSWWTGSRRWTGCSPAGCRHPRWRSPGPALVALAALWADPMAALVLVLCGLLVPVGDGGWPALVRPRPRARQFLALARLQARFLDRVRGIATIVLDGRAEDEARRSPPPRTNCGGAPCACCGSRSCPRRRSTLPAAAGAGGAWRFRYGLRVAAARGWRGPTRRCSRCCWCRSSSPRCVASPPPIRTGCTPRARPTR